MMLLGKYVGLEFYLVSFFSTRHKHLESHVDVFYILLANHDKEDWIDGEKTEDVVAFLDRLYTAKRKVEERIVILGGEDESVCNIPAMYK